MSIHDRGGRNGYTSAHSSSVADGNEAGRVLVLVQQDQVLSQVPPIRHATFLRSHRQQQPHPRPF